MHRSPRLDGLPFSRRALWMIRAILSVLWDRSGERLISLPGLHKLLKRLRVRYKRGRVPIHSPDLRYEYTQALIRQAQTLSRADPVRFSFLSQDEMTSYRRPRLGRVYSGIGQRAAEARQYAGPNTRRRIAGCVDLHTGAVLARQRTTFVVPEVVTFLRWVEQQYAEAQTIFIAWDNWSNHVHPYVRETLEGLDSRIHLLSLPT